MFGAGQLSHSGPLALTLSHCCCARQMAQQARQVLAACEKSPSDAIKLDYDPRNPFDVCSVTFTPIYRGASAVATLLTQISS